jgi:predicted lipid-binding transport protein (Tim44 family)
MALLDQQAPDWVSGILAKRATNAANPVASPTPSGPDNGIFGGLLGGLMGAYQGMGISDKMSPLLNIFDRLNTKLGGASMMPGAAAPTTPAGPTRPDPVQFDPMAYLYSRLGPGPWAAPPKTPFT